MIVDFALLAGFIALFIWFFSKIPFTSKQARYLEVLGYCILFAAIIWGDGFVDLAVLKLGLNPDLSIVYKLDNMFYYLQYLSGDANIDSAVVIEAFNRDLIDEAVNSKLIQATVIRNWALILSTILISTGRLHEVLHKEKS